MTDIRSLNSTELDIRSSRHQGLKNLRNEQQQELKNLSSSPAKDITKISKGANLLLQLEQAASLLGISIDKFNVNMDELNAQNIAPAMDVLTAFNKILSALFDYPSKAPHGDIFEEDILNSPEDFGLPNPPSPAQIQQAIKDILTEYPISFNLVHRSEGENMSAGIFSPEYGESADDYWVWHLELKNCPGPLWGMVNKQGTEPAYSYGYW